MTKRLTDEWLLDNIRPDSTILDIGCNDGYDSIRLSSLFPNSKIFAFEPEPRSLDVFRSKGIPDNVKVFDFAFSDTDGVSEFWRCSGFEPDRPGQRESDWSGSLLEPKIVLDAVPWMKFNTTFNVTTKRLDTWAIEAALDRINFIWMDVQGAEHLVFSGASKVLDKISYIHTEFDNRELYSGQKSLNELMEYLPGFEISQQFDYDVLLKNKKH